MDIGAQNITVSAISIWEVAVKWTLRRGRSDDMPMSAKAFIYELGQAGVAPLAVSAQHAAAVDDIPLLLRDPFDRFLVATAKFEGMTFLTHDNALAVYGDFVMVV